MMASTAKLADLKTILGSASAPFHLLLGNGFSIACTKSFKYDSLLDQAEFGGRNRDRRVREAFDLAATADFEAVILRFEEASATAGLYKAGAQLADKMHRDADAVRRGLAGAVAKVHPARIDNVGDSRLDRCNDFLQGFDSLFTTSYDLLLYWAVNRRPRMFDDGFRKAAGDELVHTRPDAQNVHWLHGGLHLSEVERVDGSIETVKTRWTNGYPIVDQIRDGIGSGNYPLVVAEATGAQKLRAIHGSSYLSHCLESLRASAGTLVTFGWGMNSSDQHIRQAIIHSGLKHLWIGIRPRSTRKERIEWQAGADLLVAESHGRVTVHLWDTATAAAW